MSGTYPMGFAHLGMTVPDIDKAIDWYGEVLNWELLKEPMTVEANEGYPGRQAVNLLGEFETMRVAHLVTGNQVGLELFEFTNTSGENSPNPIEPGPFHFCVYAKDVEGVAKKIDETGGVHDTKIWNQYEDDDRFKTTYCRDPFGNIVELYSHSQEIMQSQPDQ